MAIGCLCMTAVSEAEPLGFAYTRLVGTESPVPLGEGTFSYMYEPGVDANGDVAFRGQDANGDSGVYAIRSGLLEKIADESDFVPGSMETYSSFDDHVEIRNGMVLFDGKTGSGASAIHRLILSDGMQTTLIASQEVTQVPGEDAGVVIDYIDNGEGYGFDGTRLAFTAQWEDGAGNGMLLAEDGKLTTLVKEGDPAPGGNLFGCCFDDAMVDVRGEGIVFQAISEAGGNGIWLVDNNGTELIADLTVQLPEAGGTFTSLYEPDIDGGWVAVGGGRHDVRGVYLFDGTELSVIVDSSDTLPSENVITNPVRDVAISDETVAFKANNSELVVWRDGELHTALAVGDLLDGQIVSSLAFRRHCFENGRIGVRVGFEDDSYALYLIEIIPACASLDSLGEYAAAGNPIGIEIQGDTAFVADGSTGVHLVDVSNAAAPTLIATYPVLDDGYGMAVVDDTLYIASIGPGLEVIEVSDPVSPVLLGSVPAPGGINDVTVEGEFAYVANRSAGVQIYDVSNPATPALVGTHATPVSPISITVDGQTAYVAAGVAGLLILDMSNPASPTLLGTYDTPDWAIATAINGTNAFVADRFSGMLVLDVADPASPVLLGSYDTPDLAADIRVSANTAFVTDFSSGVLVIDVSDPAAPVWAGTFDTPGIAYRLAVVGETAYVADDPSGMLILDINNECLGGGAVCQSPLADERFDVNGLIKTCDLNDATGGDDDCRSGAAGLDPQTVCRPLDTGGTAGACYVARNRYLAVRPNPDNDGIARAYRVSIDTGRGDCSATEVLGFVQPVETLDNAPSAFGQTVFHKASLGETPVYDLFETHAEGYIHVGDCAISPGDGAARVYCVQCIDELSDVGDEAAYSAPLILPTTSMFGDVTGGGVPGSPPDNSVSLSDAFSVVLGFQQNNNEMLDWLDVVGQGASPNLVVNLADALAVVQGFQGVSSTLPHPLDCP